MSSHPELEKISQITPQIYLSGINPFKDPSTLKKLGIKYVVSCVDAKYVASSHEKIREIDPDVTIIYLHYNDNLYQNLWEANDGRNCVHKFRYNSSDYQISGYLQRLYSDKPMIEVGYHAIDSIVRSGQSVLIHCMAGVSRSASLVIYYLMKTHGIDFDTAYRIVKGRRSIINPNKSFQAQLKRYQMLKENCREADCHEIINHVLSTA